MRSFNVSEWAVTHRAMVFFLIVGSLLVGTFAFSRLGRLEDPNFTVPMMTAVVSWPGATAQQVQDQVLNRMERQVLNIEGVDYVRSFARQGYGGLTLSMKGGTPSRELDSAWYQARKKIGDIRQTFPAGVVGPVYNDEFSDVYSVLYAVGAPDLGWPELQMVAEDIKRAIQSLPGVNKVDVMGRQGERIHVEFSSQRLGALGLTPRALSDALVRENTLAAAGSSEGSTDRVFVRVGDGLHDVTDVGNVTVSAGGRLLRLADVASVRTGPEDPASFTIRHNGKPVVAIGLTFDRGGDVLALGAALDRRMGEVTSRLPVGITVEKVADQPKIIEESLWEFERSFLEALAIVLGVCFVFLGLRTGIVVAASVPLVLAIVATVMLLAGWNLDRISLGALIIALGLLVDDAIIAVEMMVVKIEQGWDRVRAATFAYTSTAFPMLTGTLVTIAGFMPVGFARSIAGEYAGGIFWVVGIALIASWCVAVVFTPYLGVVLLPKTMRSHGDPYGSRIYERLRRIVRRCIARKGWVLCIAAMLLAAAVAGMDLVQKQFFPTASRPELIVDLRLREGASHVATERQVRRLEEILKKDPEIRHFTAYTGAGSPRFFLSLANEQPNPGFAQFVLSTAGVEQREAVRKRLMDLFDAGEAFPDLRGRVTRFEFGPPVGFPVQFRIVGPDTSKVREIAGRVRDQVRQSPLVRDTHLDWNEQVRTVRVDVDRAKASLLGISEADVSAMVQTVLSGLPVTQIRRGEDLVDVVLRAVPQERGALQSLGDVSIFAPSGEVVPLSQLARVTPAFEEPVLWRRDRETTLTVRSDVVDGVQGPHATSSIWPTLRPVVDSLPSGYRIEIGGATEESQKSNRALYAVFPVMLVVMLLVLMVQLQSGARVLLVFLTAPLGLIGVVPALLAFQAPFGFVALLGVIALGGMIMRNSVILVDQIDRDIAQGATKLDALVEATVRRARPVVLTAAAAILAMVPLTRSIFWGPMAIAIMGGLVVATVMTLLVVPALYATLLKTSPPRAVAPVAAEGESGEPQAQPA